MSVDNWVGTDEHGNMVNLQVSDAVAGKPHSHYNSEEGQTHRRRSNELVSYLKSHPAASLVEKWQVARGIFGGDLPTLYP